MCRAKRRFEERKHKLKKINSIYDWGRTDWDGKYIRRDWSYYWWFSGGKEEPIKWWKHSNFTCMSESGHSAWVHDMMTKPYRAKSKMLQRSLAAGRIDPDEALFPVWGKPWIYYW